MTNAFYTNFWILQVCGPQGFLPISSLLKGGLPLSQFQTDVNVEVGSDFWPLSRANGFNVRHFRSHDIFNRFLSHGVGFILSSVRFEFQCLIVLPVRSAGRARDFEPAQSAGSGAQHVPYARCWRSQAGALAAQLEWGGAGAEAGSRMGVGGERWALPRVPWGGFRHRAQLIGTETHFFRVPARGC